MNNTFDKLLQVYSDEHIQCSKTQTLEELEEKYINLASTRQSIFELIETISTTENGEMDYGPINKFTALERKMEDTHEIPIFVEDDFDQEESFIEYEGYYTRYGCDMPEWIISWNVDSILIWDGDSGCQIIPRPDVLMGSV